MPKLPDIEYAVVTQGPPNPMQAFGAVAQGIEALDAVTSRAAASYAEELAKTQVSEASLLVEQGLADTEQKLQKPYLTPEEVKSAFPNGVPPEIATILGRYEGAGDAAVPTHEVGSAIHAEVGKQLTAQATPLVYNPARRAEFERRLAAETLHRNVRVSQAMMSQGAELNAAKDISLAEARARVAVTPSDWAKVYTGIENSGWLSPAQKVKLAEHFAGLQDTQGKQRTAAGLAETALAAGRDGVSPWLDTAKANEAFEKSIIGKDPLVVEDARQRYAVALSQNETMRRANDAPLLGAIESDLARGRGLSRISGPYTKLSPQGQGDADKMALAAWRSSKAASAEDRRLQADLNRNAVATFRAVETLEQKAAVTDEQIKTMFPDADDTTRKQIQAERNAAKTAWQKGHGLTEKQFIDQAVVLAVGLGWVPKGKRSERAKLFEDAMRVEYAEWGARDENQGKKPSQAEADEMFRRALRYGEQAVDPTRTMPEWMQSQPDMYAFEAKTKGVPFTDKGFEKKQPAEKLTKGKVRVRRKADGVEGFVTNPDLSVYEVIP
jgi:hypothetical protein